MRRLIMLNHFTIALLLIACARTDPVDENAVAPTGAVGGDMSATGLAAPANAAAAAAAEQAALPPVSGGLGWTYNPQEATALFGPPGTPALSIQCQRPKEGQTQLIFVRHIPPASGTQATLSFTGNGQAASLPVSPVTNPDGIGGHWRAAVPPDEYARDVSEAFAGPGPVEVSVSGTPPLVVPAGAEPRRVFRDCLG